MSLDTDTESLEPPSLRAQASRAFGWSFLNTVIGRFGTLAIGIVLANLLGPSEFGTFAVAMVAMMAVLSFNELGVSLAIVRWPNDPKTIAPTVNTIAVVMSVLLVVAMWLAAPGFASAMGDPKATLVVQLMSFSVLINGVVAVPAALLQRNFQGGRRMAADQVNTWLGAGVSLLLAFLGFGAMSLAIGRLAGSLASAIMLLAWSPLPFRFGFDRSSAGQLLRFGLPLAGASVIVFASGYSDQLVAGAQLGATALGFYVLAFNLSNWPVSIFSQPLRNVAPAAFSRLQHDPQQMHRAFYTVGGLLASVAFPACAVLAGASAAVVSLVYKDVWAPSAGVLLWLGIAASLRIMFELSYDFLVVRGQSRAILIAQAIWLAASVPLLILGGHTLGLVGIAIAQLAVAAVVMGPLYTVLMHRAGLSAMTFVKQLALPAVVAALVGIASWLIVAGLGGGRSHAAVGTNLLACAVSGVVGLLGIGVLILRRRADLGLLRSLRRKASDEAAA